MPRKRKAKKPILKKSARQRKPRPIMRSGIEIQPNLSKIDLRDAPSILRGFSVGTEGQKLDKIQKRRDKLLKKVSGKGGLRVKFKRPGFAKKNKRLSDLHNPNRSGRPREHYYYFVEFEYSIINDYTEEKAQALVATEEQSRKLNFAQIDSVLTQYFAKATVGSRASWTPRPPTQADRINKTYNVRQTLQSYRKKGLDKKQLREIIASVDSRLKGFAIVTGIRGVWRSQRSEEFSFRESKKRGQFVKRQTKAKGKPRKPKRSKRI